MIFIILLLLTFSVFLELDHRSKRKSPLVLKPRDFKTNISDSKHKYIALVEIINTNKKMEVMIPSFKVIPKLIGISNSDIINLKTKIKLFHPDEIEQENDYWTAYIVKGKKSTKVQIEIEFEIENLIKNNLECLWIDIEWVNYGPFGFFSKFDGFVLPNYLRRSKKKPLDKDLIIPIKTHILGSLDDPIDVLKNYIPRDCQSTDILTIGETPLAIMQGRYIDFRSLNVSPLSKLICKGFHPTSSLASACGMQTLINIYGPTRILISWLIGAILKLLGIKGIFYRLAGEQARLIDDITGTTPPYDKNIVLGPQGSKAFCKKASKELGINIAVVDVNDLGRVKKSYQRMNQIILN